jgi:DNA-3-methyladenine glycosylase
MYWMLNIVTGNAGNPQAVLIRGIRDYNGPGKLTRKLKIDHTYNGEDICTSKKIWIESNGTKTAYNTAPRIGIDYAGELWKNKPWRFYINTF